MSGAVLNSRFLTRLLTSGEEDIELQEVILSITCKPTILILSISVTFNVTCLTASNVGQYILVHFMS